MFEVNLRKILFLQCRSGKRNTPSFKPYPHEENLQGVDLTTRISSRWLLMLEVNLRMNLFLLFRVSWWRTVEVGSAPVRRWSKPSPTPQTQFTEGLKGRSKDTESASPEKGHVGCLRWCMVLPLLSNNEAPETLSTPVSIQIKKRTFRQLGTNSDMQFNSKKQFSVRRNTKHFAPCTMENLERKVSINNWMTWFTMVNASYGQITSGRFASFTTLGMRTPYYQIKVSKKST